MGSWIHWCKKKPRREQQSEMSHKDQLEINPRWVIHTLKHRGLPEVSLEAMQFGIASFTTEKAEDFRARVARLLGGREHASDMDTMAEWARVVKKAFTETEKRPVPAAVEPELQSSNFGLPTSRVFETPARPDIARDVVADPERHKLLHPEHRNAMRESAHVYGAKAALCVEPALIEDIGPDQRAPVFHTLALEMASARGNGHYDWDSKIVFRLTKREMPLFVAAMMGWIPTLSMANHGNEKDKALEITDQGGSIFFKLRQAKRAIAVPMPAEEVFAVTTLALTTLVRNAPQLDTQTMMMVVKRAATMYQMSGTK